MSAQLFFIAAFSAFVALAWKNALNDFPRMRGWIRGHFAFIPRKLLLCGFCFTSWLSLAVILTVAYPASLWALFSTWAAVALIAVALRNSIIALEEFVHYEVHVMSGREQDVH
jgi:hypothetical protein